MHVRYQGAIRPPNLASGSVWGTAGAPLRAAQRRARRAERGGTSDFLGFEKCPTKENANLARPRGISIIQTRAYYGGILIASKYTSLFPRPLPLFLPLFLFRCCVRRIAPLLYIYSTARGKSSSSSLSSFCSCPCSWPCSWCCSWPCSPPWPSSCSCCCSPPSGSLS